MTYKELDKPLYHGTFENFSEIDISKSAPKKDFGQGFYLTNDIDQAKKFARLKAVRENRRQGYLLTFNFTESDNLSVKQFTSSNEEWFDFVLRNRGAGNYASKGPNESCDIVIGPVANDAVGVVLNNFIDGVYGDQYSADAKNTAIRLLLSQKLHNQVFFGTKNAIRCLSLKEKLDVFLD
ncbi:MAG: DUF3990 domain-containing protein [Clostridiales Family XIII bacterium]|nr:DUF3990 domain-containing protein [Clostridiales Family XIII bacterium]